MDFKRKGIDRLAQEVSNMTGDGVQPYARGN